MKRFSRLLSAVLAVIMLFTATLTGEFAIGASPVSASESVSGKTVAPPITDYDGLIIEFESAAYLEIYARVNGGVKLGGNMMKIAGGYEEALKYGELSYVKSVTYNYIVTADEVYDYTSVPNDSSYASQTGLITNQALTGWKALYDYAAAKVAEEEGYSLSVVKVAVLDTGINGTHPDLVGRVIDGYDFVNDTVAFATVNSDISAASGSHHGTKVAGILAASANNSEGIAGAAGCFPVAMMPVCVLNERGNGTIANVISGIYWAMDNGANIINMSFGKRMTTFPTALSNAVKEAAAAGILIFAAGGNENGKDVEGYYPACLDGVYPVLSYVDMGSGFYALSDFSNKVTDSNKTHFAAMGDNVFTTVGNGYGTFTGTSAATPFIAGYAAAIMSVIGTIDTRNSEQTLEVLKDACSLGREYGTGGFPLWETVNFSTLTDKELDDAFIRLGYTLKPGFSFDGPKAGTLITGRQTMSVKVVSHPELVEKVVFYYSQYSSNKLEIIEMFDRREDNTYSVTFNVADLDVDYRYTFDLHAVVGMAGDIGEGNWFGDSMLARVDVEDMERMRWEYGSEDRLLLMKDAEGGLIGNADILVLDTETGEAISTFTTDRNGIADFTLFYEYRYYTLVAAFDNILAVGEFDTENLGEETLVLGGTALRRRMLSASSSETVLSGATVYAEVLGNLVTVGNIGEDGTMELSVGDGTYNIWVVDDVKGYVLHKTVTLDEEMTEISFASEIGGAVTVTPAPAEAIGEGNTLKLGFTDGARYGDKERIYFTMTGESVKVSQGNYSVTATVLFGGTNYIEVLVGNAIAMDADKSLSFDYLTVNLNYLCDKEVYHFNEEAVITRVYTTDGGHTVVGAGNIEGEDLRDGLHYAGFDEVEGNFENNILRINTSKFPLESGVVTLVTRYLYPEDYSSFGITLRISDLNINIDLGKILTVNAKENFNEETIPGFYSSSSSTQLFRLVNGRYTELTRYMPSGYVDPDAPFVFSLGDISAGTVLLVATQIHYNAYVDETWHSYDVVTYNNYTYGGAKSESYAVPYPTELRTITLNCDSEEYYGKTIYLTPVGKPGATVGIVDAYGGTPLQVGAGAYEYCVALNEFDYETQSCDYYLSEGTLGATETIINAGKAGLTNTDLVKIIAEGSDELRWMVGTKLGIDLNQAHIVIDRLPTNVYPSGAEINVHYASGTPTYTVSAYVEDAYPVEGVAFIPTPTVVLAVTKKTDLTPASITARVNVEKSIPLPGMAPGQGPEEYHNVNVRFLLKDAFGSIFTKYSFVDLMAAGGKGGGAVSLDIYPTYDLYRSGVKIIAGKKIESYNTLYLGEMENGSYAVQIFFTLPDNTVIASDKIDFEVGEAASENFAYITAPVTETKKNITVTVSGVSGASVTLFYQHIMGEEQSFTGFTVPESGSMEIPLVLDQEGMWYIWAEATLDEDVKESEKLVVFRDTTAPAVPTFNYDVIDADEMDFTVTVAQDAVRTYLFRDGKKIANLLGSGTVRENYLDGARIYTYSAYSEDSVGNVSETVYLSVRTVSDTESPTVPQHLEGESSGCSSIYLEWWSSSDNVMVGGYHIYRDGVLVGSTAKYYYTDTGLTLGTTYTYTVKAFDLAGNESGASNAVSVTTKSTAGIYAFDVTAERKPNGLLKNDNVKFRVLTARASDGVAYGKVFVVYTDVYDIDVEKTAVIDLAGDAGDLYAEITIDGLDSLHSFTARIYTADDILIDERQIIDSALPYRKGGRVEVVFETDLLGDYTEELWADCELELVSQDGSIRKRTTVPENGIGVFRDVEPIGLYDIYMYLKNANGEFFKEPVWTGLARVDASKITDVNLVSTKGTSFGPFIEWDWNPTAVFVRLIGVKKNGERIPLQVNMRAHVDSGSLIDAEFVALPDGTLTVNGRHNLAAAEGEIVGSDRDTSFYLYCPNDDLYTPDGVTYFNVQQSDWVFFDTSTTGLGEAPYIIDVYFNEAEYTTGDLTLTAKVEGGGSVDGKSVRVHYNGKVRTVEFEGKTITLEDVRIFKDQYVRIEGTSFRNDGIDYVIRDQRVYAGKNTLWSHYFDVELDSVDMNVHIDIPEEIKAVLPLTEDGQHYDIPFIYYTGEGHTYIFTYSSGVVYPNLDGDLIFSCKKEKKVSVSLYCEAKSGYYFVPSQGDRFRVSSKNATITGEWQRIYVPDIKAGSYLHTIIYDVTEIGQEKLIYNRSYDKTIYLTDDEVSGRELVAFIVPSGCPYENISYADAVKYYGYTATPLDTSADFSPLIIYRPEMHDNAIWFDQLKDYGGETVGATYYLFAKSGGNARTRSGNRRYLVGCSGDNSGDPGVGSIPVGFTEFELIGTYLREVDFETIEEMLESEGEVWSKLSFSIEPDRLESGNKKFSVTLPDLSIVTSWNINFTDETGDPLKGIQRGCFRFGGEGKAYERQETMTDAGLKLTLRKDKNWAKDLEKTYVFHWGRLDQLFINTYLDGYEFFEENSRYTVELTLEEFLHRKKVDVPMTYTDVLEKQLESARQELNDYNSDYTKDYSRRINDISAFEVGNGSSMKVKFTLHTMKSIELMLELPEGATQLSVKARSANAPAHTVNDGILVFPRLDAYYEITFIVPNSEGMGTSKGKQIVLKQRYKDQINVLERHSFGVVSMSGDDTVNSAILSYESGNVQITRESIDANLAGSLGYNRYWNVPYYDAEEHSVAFYSGCYIQLDSAGGFDGMKVYVDGEPVVYQATLPIYPETERAGRLPIKNYNKTWIVNTNFTNLPVDGEHRSEGAVTLHYGSFREASVLLPQAEICSPYSVTLTVGSESHENPALSQSFLEEVFDFTKTRGTLFVPLPCPITNGETHVITVESGQQSLMHTVRINTNRAVWQQIDCTQYVTTANDTNCWTVLNLNRPTVTVDDIIAYNENKVTLWRSCPQYSFKVHFDEPTKVKNVYVFTDIEERYGNRYVQMHYNQISGLWEGTGVLGNKYVTIPSEFYVVYDDVETKYNKTYVDRLGGHYPSYDLRGLGYITYSPEPLPESITCTEIAPSVSGVGVTLEKARENRDRYFDFLNNWSIEDYQDEKKVKALFFGDEEEEIEGILDENKMLWFPSYDYYDIETGETLIHTDVFSFADINDLVLGNLDTSVVHTRNDSALLTGDFQVIGDTCVVTMAGSPEAVMPLANVFGDTGVFTMSSSPEAVMPLANVDPARFDVENDVIIPINSLTVAAATAMSQYIGNTMIRQGVESLSTAIDEAAIIKKHGSLTPKQLSNIIDIHTKSATSQVNTGKMLSKISQYSGSGITLAMTAKSVYDHVNDVRPMMRDALEADWTSYLTAEQYKAMRDTLFWQEEFSACQMLADLSGYGGVVSAAYNLLGSSFNKKHTNGKEDYNIYNSKERSKHIIDKYEHMAKMQEQARESQREVNQLLLSQLSQEQRIRLSHGMERAALGRSMFDVALELGLIDELEEEEEDDDDDDDDGDGDGGPENDGPKKNPKLPKKPGRSNPPVLYDPSGYIFEGVDSNRISGVTATIYYLDTETNEWIAWNSEDYDQGPNPNISDLDGKYGWDVLAGKWKVVFEKDGYYTAESVVLDVPPPHDDVNISIVSYESPKIVSITAEENGSGLTIRYDKPVRVDDVTGFLKVNFAGDTIDGTFTALDAALTQFGNKQSAEVTSLESGLNVAMVFRFTPDVPLTPATAVIIKASEGIRGYNGVETAEYVSDAVVIPDALPISAMSFIKEAYTLSKGGTLDLSSVMTKVGTTGTLAWESLDTSVATVSESGVVTAVSEGSTFVRVTCGELVALVQVNVETTKHTLTVHYYFHGTENMARPDYVAELEAGEAYSILSADKPKYAYDTERVEGVMGNEDVEITVYYDVALPIFTNVSISLDSDITAYYYISDSVYEDVKVRFTLNGYTKTVSGTKAENEYVFAFDGVAPQWIGDNITAELIVNGDVVETKVYTLTTYLNNLKNATAAQLGMSEEKFGKMNALINDLLVYCGAAQTYTDHNAESLVSEGIIGTDFVPVTETDKTMTNNGEYVTFNGMTVFFDSVNKLMFRFASTDLTGVTFKLKVGDGEEREIGYVQDGENYIITTEGIKAVGFDDVYTITAYKNDVAGATVTYSVKSYVYSKQNAASDMAKLAKATYNYGLSAKAFALAK